MWLAHSAEKDVQAQTYRDHILGVFRKAHRSLVRLRPFLSKDQYVLLRTIVLRAAIYHDMGKLCDNCQRVLRGEVAGKMPNHVDAGVAFLLRSKRKDFRLSAWIVLAHHRGYDFYPELDEDFRDRQILAGRCGWVKNPERKMSDYTDQNLNVLVARHNHCVKLVVPEADVDDRSVTAAFMRIALSCLVDADHYDTAKNYQNFVIERRYRLRPEERLASLDRHVQLMQAELPEGVDLQRHKIRQDVYNACRRYTVENSIVECASEVGTGKTLATLAYALEACRRHGLRRIIYVAPFVNIISQTVNSYRKAVRLPKERPEQTVAEHHHQIEFDFDDDCRQEIRAKVYSTTWEPPIICTTAVQFFETMASCRTGRLRKLHQLLGSVIIIDESHTSIPPALWPITLRWLKYAVENFNCRVVLASGSITRFWNMENFRQLSGFDMLVPSLMPKELSDMTLSREKARVPIKYHKKQWLLHEFAKWTQDYTGSKFVICNTINNAARIAVEMQKLYGSENVLHLSTCLTPMDREKVMAKLKDYLKRRKHDDWVLVATSCVEAGVDLSFRYGWREVASVTSSLQAAGRVRRNDEPEFNDSILWVFELRPDKKRELVTQNPSLEAATGIFRDMEDEGKIGPEWATEAMRRECACGLIVTKKEKQDGPVESVPITVEQLMDMEDRRRMREVSSCYQVIGQEKITVVIDEAMLSKPNITTTEITRNSVQIIATKAENAKYPIRKSDVLDGFWGWSGQYDPEFLGYMAHFVGR
jgi:CRISPR-associated endonuclease/helicase Cas3